MISSSLKTQDEIFTKMDLLPQHWNFSNYAEVWTKAEFGRYFLNSVIYTVFGVFGVVFISSLAAYGFARLEIPGKEFYISAAGLNHVTAYTRSICSSLSFIK